MNFEQIRLIAEEHGKNGLLMLPNHFYRDLRLYIQEVQDELNKTDSEAPDYQILADELKVVQRFADRILLNRVDKILNLASRSMMNDINIDTSMMEDEECKMFNIVKKGIAELKKELLCTCEEGINQGEYTMVRAVMDISTFSGPDGLEYTLHKDDVATIPDSIANVLIGRHVAIPA